MHDFDIIRRETTNPTRSFRIGGEEFTFRPTCSANTLANYFDAPTTRWDECPHCHEKLQIGSLRPALDQLEAIDNLILEMLEPGQEEKWAAVRASKEDPITLRQLQDVANHLVEAITGRPTERPSDSSSTASDPGTKLTENSAEAAVV